MCVCVCVLGGERGCQLSVFMFDTNVNQRFYNNESNTRITSAGTADLNIYVFIRGFFCGYGNPNDGDSDGPRDRGLFSC